ncbi:MAG: TlpA family protein disulfide reductase [Flavobacteriaceae bacterium]|nr:TlpA family protein disulfide reductase [Flavobacteriaceae bacterium]
MKKITLLLAVVILLSSCKKEHANYVKFSGKIENLNPTDTILSIRNNVLKKTITIDKDGSFNDTLSINTAGYYTLALNGKNVGFIFLRNGFDLNLTTDKNSFYESSTYTGNGSNSINYLQSQFKLGRSFGDPRAMFSLEKDVFLKKIKAMRSSFDSLKKSYTDIDTMLVRTNDKRNSDFFNMLEKSFDQQHARAKQQGATKNKLTKGKPSPKFENYINYKGGKTSLDALKGKYVYIDVWATWCNPCIAEIPALKSLEKKYHTKNIRFVSISIDDQKSAGSWDKALAKWRKMVKDKNLTGTQLYAGDDIAFMKAYLVTGIPRFILIDPKGNIVNPNAPRPSDPALESLFKELGI